MDEIDKVGADFRGDPSAALLEVLDPEQNHTFQDHYLEVDFDLSEIMFVATANSMNIPPALLDRMEVIRLSGYTEDEKVNIAENYLIPKQITNNGLKEDELTISENAVRDIVRYYTREAGVRNLEREISKICRKVVKDVLLDHKKGKRVTVSPRNLDKYLGVKRFRYGRADEHDQVGQVTGLAWTEVGGELLTIEAAIIDGATPFQIFFKIKVPQIMGTIVVVWTTITLVVLKVFDIVFAFTGGGPGTATLYLVQYIYNNGFASASKEYGLAAAASVAMGLVLIVLLMSSVAIRLRNKMKKRYTFGTF